MLKVWIYSIVILKCFIVGMCKNIFLNNVFVCIWLRNVGDYLKFYNFVGRFYDYI